MMMYQLPIDMMARITRVARGTKPPSHTACRPNGLCTSSLLAGAAASAAGAAASAAGAAAGAASAAGAEAAADAGASANAGAATRAVVAVTDNRTAAKNADKRVFLNMLPPKLKITDR